MNMKDEIREFLDESIQLELNMSDLYQLFYAKFPEDSEFWWKLSVEELNHASLLRSIDEVLFPKGMIPLNDIELKIIQLREINDSIRQRIQDYDLEKPSRSETFLYAFELENSFGEIHFDLFMNDLPDSRIDTIFQKLNGEDKNHALKINEYIIQRNIV